MITNGHDEHETGASRNKIGFQIIQYDVALVGGNNGSLECISKISSSLNPCLVDPSIIDRTQVFFL